LIGTCIIVTLVSSARWLTNTVNCRYGHPFETSMIVYFLQPNLFVELSLTGYLQYPFLYKPKCTVWPMVYALKP